jgi:diguanylate cyclase (GGDEF)-like protein
LISEPAATIRSFLSRRPRAAELRPLLVAGAHPPAVSRERVSLVMARVRQIYAAFSVLTVLWIPIDAISVPWPQWGELAIGRVIASLAFAACAMRRVAWPSTTVHRQVALLFSVPIAFFFFANGVLSDSTDPASLAASTAYYYLPFIIAAGLSLFPLTAVESATAGSLVVVAMGAAVLVWPNSLDGQSTIMTLWRLALIAAISGLAGLSQLHFLIKLTEQATRDGLTGLLVRRVGEELIGTQFAYAERHNLPFSLLFIDLDHFKTVNDRFGHEAGDSVLRGVATALERAFRHQDSLIRWGGEEFVVALPGTDAGNAEAAVRRLANLGIGSHPDGKPITASIGIAERTVDAAARPRDLWDLADRRMYQAKRAGRNRYVAQAQPVLWIGPRA